VLTEAVQSRLAALSGARDDFSESNYQESRPLSEPAELVSFCEDAGLAGEDDLDSVIRHSASLVAAVAGTEPFAVRLDHEDLGIPAVKVLAPACAGWIINCSGTTDPVARPAALPGLTAEDD
jgi:ribosomal protein S12 methylthiotransferase accessory factor YcaO